MRGIMKNRLIKDANEGGQNYERHRMKVGTMKNV